MASTAKKDNRIIGRLLDAMDAAEGQEGEPLTEAIEMYLVKRPHSKRRLRRHVISMVDRPRPGGRLSPSSLGGCKRESVFKFVGMPGQRKIDADLELIFEDGNWRHHKWQALMLDMEKVLGRRHFRVVSFESAAVYEGLYIAGHLDVHVVIKGVHYIIDIKGINSWGFKRVALQERKPLPHHVDQVMGYMKAKKVKRGIILYDCKDNQDYRSFLFHYDKDVWKETVNWADSVITSMENRRLPPKHPECHNGQFKYNRCIYKYLCFGKKESHELEEMAYKDFVSVEAAWAEGFAAFEAAMEAAA